MHHSQAKNTYSAWLRNVGGGHSYFGSSTIPSPSSTCCPRPRAPLCCLRIGANEQFERYYNVKDKAMLAWDRIVGNLLEQAMPFLTLFWLNIGLAALGATSHTGVAIAGWIYVVFRALYPVSTSIYSVAPSNTCRFDLFS